MFKNITAYLILSFFFLNNAYSFEFLDKTGSLAIVAECQEQDLPDCENVFVLAFSKAYEDLTPQQLGVEDKLTFLKEAFADVHDDVKKGLQKLTVVKINGEIVGLVGFKPTEEPNQIYISQLAVHPDYWQRGIGRHLVFSALDVYDNVASLVVIPRKLNRVGRHFYSSLGFEESGYMHPGYNPERYIGYEWKATVLKD